MDMEGLEPEIEIDIVLADSNTMRDLNRQFRDIDAPTDVLSFANAPDEIWTWPDEPPSLGEVVVGVMVAEAQAQETGQDVKGTIAHALVHGVLHMIGYDHEDGPDHERMKKREDEILKVLGYEGDYHYKETEH